MFEFLLSEEKKMRRHAANWLEVAERVFHFRRDLLTDIQRQQLHGATGELKLRLKEKADTAKLKLAIEKLEDVLEKNGGRQYPANSIVENVEFFLVAAIVILGLRAYFVQPFKIPTNSMWPTYYGMTHEIFKPEAEPGLLARAGRFLAFGASRYDVTSPADGEVYVAVNQDYSLARSVVTKRMLLVIPTTREEYYFSVGDEIVKVDVPADFNFYKVLDEKFRGTSPRLVDALHERRMRGEGRLQGSVLWIPLGRSVSKGETIATFHILTGDLLFVDRVSYNFFPPKVGQGFVFRTDNIHSPNMERPQGSGNQIKNYYIKRLVGIPGDSLEVRAPALWRNGQPIAGAAAFDKNALLAEHYPGYNNIGKLPRGVQLPIPEHNYFAMGDNSPESADSRYWGFVPEKDVVGKPLFIYYPLTKRWGPAQ